MRKHLRPRFFVEAGLAVLSTVLAVVTAVWPDWLEIVFNIDPDGHSGAWEWLIVVMAAALAVTFSIASRREWRMAAE
jgi:hypothetical protein